MSRNANPQIAARRTPTQERSQATVEAILIAAAQVFERDGYAAATTDGIAERAGVSRSDRFQRHVFLKFLALGVDLLQQSELVIGPPPFEWPAGDSRLEASRGTPSTFG